MQLVISFAMAGLFLQNFPWSSSLLKLLGICAAFGILIACARGAGIRSSFPISISRSGSPNLPFRCSYIRFHKIIHPFSEVLKRICQICGLVWSSCLEHSNLCRIGCNWMGSWLALIMKACSTCKSWFHFGRYWKTLQRASGSVTGGFG